MAADDEAGGPLYDSDVMSWLQTLAKSFGALRNNVAVFKTLAHYHVSFESPRAARNVVSLFATNPNATTFVDDDVRFRLVAVNLDVVSCCCCAARE